ncbi:MAG: glycosyltransferase family 2 protein [Deltaproteobacteria bacterium]|nr:glycosyltransferase family 2 protein [Deltaproteobacteria bacterium]
MRYSIVIPVYNEARIVREAATELSQKLDAMGWDYELLLTENGSKDGTLDILTRLSSERPRVRFLHSDEPNYGKALKAGILDAKGDIVFCDEIDLCDTDFYQRALPLLEQGADMIVGSKAMRGANDARPPFRRFATRVINLLLRFATGFKGTDTHGLKAFKRERLLDVARACVIDRDLFASEFVIRAGRMKRDVREIPITLAEKRPPSIQLMRRVPRVLSGLVKLGWHIRIVNR